MNRKKPTTADTGDGDQDESTMFRRAVAGATPLKRDFVEAVKRRPPPRARFSRRDEQAVLEKSLDADIDELEASAGERVQFRRNEVGPRTLRRLIRGRYSVQAELDLHGLTAERAETLLREFIDDCCRTGYRCVRIVHGKGINSGSRGPVLKPRVLTLLRRWRDILAFATARQIDGGSGAVYALLRERRAAGSR